MKSQPYRSAATVLSVFGSRPVRLLPPTLRYDNAVSWSNVLGMVELSRLDDTSRRLRKQRNTVTGQKTTV